MEQSFNIVKIGSEPETIQEQEQEPEQEENPSVISNEPAEIDFEKENYIKKIVSPSETNTNINEPANILNVEEPKEETKEESKEEDTSSSETKSVKIT